MEWILSPSNFFTAIETSRDVAEQYRNASVGTPPPHPLKKQNMPEN